MPININEVTSQIPKDIQDVIARAIMGAENNSKNHGVLSVSTKNPKKVLNDSVKNNWKRWSTGQTPAPWIKEKPKKFVDFMQKRWAPVGAENDPNNLNKNWAPNVRGLIKKQVGSDVYNKLKSLNIVQNINPFSATNAYAETVPQENNMSYQPVSSPLIEALRNPHPNDAPTVDALKSMLFQTQDISAPRTIPQQMNQPQQNTNSGQSDFGNFLTQLGIPLATAALGVVAPQTLPGAAGFQTGYQAGRQQDFENKLRTEEQRRKNQLYSSGKSVFQVDPITGELNQVGNVGYRDIVQKGVMSPDQMKQRAVAQGEADFTKKNMEQSGKLGTAIKRLALLNRQYKDALPSGDRTPLEQRFYGGAESWAAKKGLINNPQLVALQKNIRPMAINLIRAFGEVGNLSESEQKGAIETVDLPGLTDQERIAQTKQFIEFALAGANPEGIKMLASQPDMKGVLDAFNVDLSQFEGNGNTSIPEVGGTFNGEKVKKVTRIQ